MNFIKSGNSKWRYRAGAVLLALLVVVAASGVLSPRQVQAIPVEVLTNLVDDIYRAARFAWQVAIKQAFTRYLRQYAQEAGKYVATGGKGQKPVFRTKEFSKEVTSSLDALTGDYLSGIIPKSWGVSLCEPLDPKFKFNITALLLTKYQLPGL
ncbi:MAG: hypothetical protein V1707_03780, partial [bacterium]